MICTKGQNLFIPLDDNYQIQEQAAVYNSSKHFHTALRAWTEYDINKMTNLDSLRATNYIRPEKSYLWNSLLNKDVVRYADDDVRIGVNPILDFEYGKENGQNLWVNRRGVEVKGDIFGKVSFYVSLNESQMRLPEYISNYVKEKRVIPGQGDGTVPFKTDAFDARTVASAYINFRPAHWFTATLGYGKNFIGDGYRSMLLSDNAFNYPYLRLTADFWHIQYSCIYSQMTDKNTLFRIVNDGTDKNVFRYGRKWVVMHYLDWAVTRRLNVGFFDVMVARAQNYDGTNRGFDFQYINPIIYLRQSDYYAGNSPDNALIGFNASFIVGKHTTIYAQFMLDEMRFKDLISQKGHIGNKQAYQLGIKSYNCFGVDNLFLQAEGNIVRPYMYAHFDGMDNYGHYNEPLAHPWGGNLWEIVLRAQYNYHRFYFQYKLNGGQFGDNIGKDNYGHDIYLDYTTYVHLEGKDGAEGHKLITGEKNTLLMNNFTVSYLVNPAYNLNIFVDATQRSLKTEGQNTNNTFFVSFGIRTSLDRHYYDL